MTQKIDSKSKQVIFYDVQTTKGVGGDRQTKDQKLFTISPKTTKVLPTTLQRSLHWATNVNLRRLYMRTTLSHE